MIYLTTFILTLLLSHIACAVPACGDAATPKDLYDYTYDDVQQPIPPPLKYDIIWEEKYDNKTGKTGTLTCSNLAKKYKEFDDIPGWPYIGGGAHIKLVSGNCQECWEFRYETNTVYVSIVDDHVEQADFAISHDAFTKLTTKGGHKLKQVEGRRVALSSCKFK